jgi:hypothetical protein
MGDNSADTNEIKIIKNLFWKIMLQQTGKSKRYG